jgi:16S rRNA G966 N2-methylase RsmD
MSHVSEEERIVSNVPAWKRIEHQHVKPLLRRLKPWRQAALGGIRIQYKRHLDGGGSSFGQDFIPFFRACGLPVQASVFEWCAGPGFIGFSMLGNGLCKHLCLADLNKEAVEACRRTIRYNGLEGRVSVYHSNNLKSIPRTEQWDLVVSNPPHFADSGTDDLRSDDRDWRIHREFFEAIGHYLKPNGVIVLQENNRGSTAESFRAMIEACGMTIVFVSGGHPQRTEQSHIYYLGVMRRQDSPPSWIKAAPA